MDMGNLDIGLDISKLWGDALGPKLTGIILCLLFCLFLSSFLPQSAGFSISCQTSIVYLKSIVYATNPT